MRARLGGGRKLWGIRMGTGPLAALLLLSCGGQVDRAARISVADGWMREIAPGQTAAAAYVTIKNDGDGDDRLVGVRAHVGEATLHSSSSSGGVARMRPIGDGLEIPAHSTVELKPGETHIMLTGLQRSLSAGQKVDASLKFAKSGERLIVIRVMPAAAGNSHPHGMKM